MLCDMHSFHACLSACVPHAAAASHAFMRVQMRVVRRQLESAQSLLILDHSDPLLLEPIPEHLAPMPGDLVQAVADMASYVSGIAL